MQARVAPGGAADLPGIFASLFDAYPDALIVADLTGRIVLANGSASTLLGYSVAELTGLPIDALVPDAVRSRHAAYRDAYGRAPRARAMGTDAELVARRKDGTEVMVEIGLSPVTSGEEHFVVAAIRSIAEFPRVKDALQRARYSEKLARLGRIAADARDPMLLLEQIPTIACEALGAETSRVLLLEPDGVHLRVAAGVGFVPDQPVGERIDARPRSMAYLVMSTGQSLLVEDLRSETRFDVPAGHVATDLLSALGVPLFDRGRTIGTLSVNARGIGRFRRHDLQFLESLSSTLATALQRAEGEHALQHAQRLESVGQLTGGIAHDFNNLLTIIQGNLQVLEELPAVAGDDYSRELVAAGLRASRRGAELTGKLLAFSRRQVLHPSRVEIEPMLASLIEMLQRTVDRRIEISARIEEPGIAVRVDPGQLESALLNIAINARDAMPDGGRLRFQTWRCDVMPPSARRETDAVTHPQSTAGGYVAVSVSDDGEGMSDEVKARAFEPFFTTKAADRGTGLGLSVVYGFVTQSSGGIEIESRPHGGTTMTLYLPADRGTGPEAAADPDTPDALPAGLRVLLAEDEADVRRVTARLLRTLGCRVTAVTTGEQALALLDRGRAFDLVLTDVALGTGIRGTRVAREARQRRPGLPVVLMSGFSPELLADSGESPLQHHELLPKPFERADLARALLRALGKERRHR